MIWLLIVLGFIFFFIWGIISFFRMIFGSPGSTTKHTSNDFEVDSLKAQVAALNNVLHELEMLARENPNKPAGQILAEIQGSIPSSQHQTTEHHLPSTPPPPPAVTEPINLQSWYDDNSINLLLYVGAFLIIAAASIFVGFSWEVLDGTLKAILFSVVTVGFFFAGLQLYNSPKTKSAGATFTAIGALLIPFTGLTWHNFAFAGAPETAGATWAITSTISISIFFYLAIKFSSKYYSYAASIASISLALSAVKIFGLNNDFYIFMGILSSYAMLAASIVYKAKNEQERQLILQPLELTSYISLPISLVLGLVVAIIDGKLYSIEAVVSVALAIGFYAIVYTQKSKAEYFAAITGLGTFLVFITTKYLLLPIDTTLYVLTITSLALLVSAFHYRTQQKNSELDILLFLSQAIMLLVFWSSWYNDLVVLQLLFGLINCATSGTIAIFKKNAYYGIIATVFSIVLPIIYTTSYLDLTNYQDTLLSIYLVFGTFGFSMLYLKYTELNKNNLSQMILASTALWYALALALSVSDNNTVFTTTLIVALVSYASAVKFQRADLYHTAQMFTAFMFYSFLIKIQIPTADLPLYFTALTLIFYGIGQLTANLSKQSHELSAKILGVAVPLLFGLPHLDRYSANQAAELNALVSLDIATIMFAYDAYIKKNANYGYVASGVAITALLWHFKTMGIDNSVVYAITLGIYFLILGYFKKYQALNGTAEVFDYIGMAFLIVPTFLSSSDRFGILYSLVLLLIGAALVAYGISTSLKRIRYGGITAIVLAILAQTSGILLYLPWWLILALLGGGFLYTAVYLLNKRK